MVNNLLQYINFVLKKIQTKYCVDAGLCIFASDPNIFSEFFGIEDCERSRTGHVCVALWVQPSGLFYPFQKLF